MSKKLGQEPAFPFFDKNEGGYGDTIVVYDQHGAKAFYPFERGISKRYLTAKDILCAVLSNPETMKSFANEKRIVDGITKEQLIIKGCYDWADLLLKKENE